MPHTKNEMQELRMKGRAELTKLLESSREELRDLRFRIATNQHKNVRELRRVRTRIARIATLLNEQKKVKGRSS